MELDLRECSLSKKRAGLIWRCPHGPSVGPDRKCGISGTAFTHDFHLRKIVEKCVEERGFKPVKRVSRKPRAFFLVRMDKSTCQSYNLKAGIFGYNGTPTKAVETLLAEIGKKYNVVVQAIVQPTHCFDLNACDALYHSVAKRRLRQFRAPLCQEHIKRDWERATREVSADGRLIQRSFWRTFERDARGDIDETLIPEDLVAWYANSEDEEDTVEEVEDDVQIT